MATGADIQRMVGDLGRVGTVASVDHAAGTCRVQLGDILSGDLPWLEARAGATRTRCAPGVGEQVFVFAMEADLGCGLVLAGISSDANPAPWSDEHSVGIMFGDGGFVHYDPAAKALTAILPAGGTAEIEAKGGITLRGDVAIDGDVTVTGKVAAEGDVTADTISLQKHVHDKVQAGGAMSGKPVA